LACLRQKVSGGNFSKAAKDLFLTSWREKHPEHMTHTFGSGWGGVMSGVWIPFQMSQIFLAVLHSQGYQTNSLNAYRSAISSVHDRVDDGNVGKHPLVARVLKGAFHIRPPLPPYTVTWNVQVVLDSILN